MVNGVGHTIESIPPKSLRMIFGCTLFTTPEYSTSEVHIVGYNISIGLKIVWT